MSDDCSYDHDKVTGPPVTLLSMPPVIRTPWICRKCLAVGVDEVKQEDPFVEFDDLHKRRAGKQ